MLRVLGRGTSGNVQKVVWLLEELGLPYKREDYGRQFNNTGGDYLKLNPNGKVPTLDDNGTIIWESNTILRYLANKNGGKFYPADPAQRSEVERWMDWQLASLNAPYVSIFKDAKKPAAERGAGWAADSKELIGLLQILENGIAGRDWIAGKEMTLADFALGSIITRCLDFPIEHPPLPKLRTWREKLLTRPAFKKAIAG
ncbi:glutathione S-transferase [Hypericibacter adhaerens]|uniref:Glutathione S-transferase n=1 Tax=Hypericibacter adhaerens TaxID=2602016 RepID=A0A5J6N3J0_9PROT|nr:glutathione S-transferase family protein [Hypericibacter adhaerens]QEX23934.1 glutathione S-transferase [Hypericibacter adhaerens]